MNEQFVLSVQEPPSWASVSLERLRNDVLPISINSIRSDKDQLVCWFQALRPALAGANANDFQHDRPRLDHFGLIEKAFAVLPRESLQQEFGHNEHLSVVTSARARIMYF